MRKSFENLHLDDDKGAQDADEQKKHPKDGGDQKAEIAIPFSPRNELFFQFKIESNGEILGVICIHSTNGVMIPKFGAKREPGDELGLRKVDSLEQHNKNLTKVVLRKLDEKIKALNFKSLKAIVWIGDGNLAFGNEQVPDLFIKQQLESHFKVPVFKVLVSANESTVTAIKETLGNQPGLRAVHKNDANKNYLPALKDAEAVPSVPVAQAAPVGQGTQPVDGDSPVGGEQPVGGDKPVGGDGKQTKDEPVVGDVTNLGDAKPAVPADGGQTRLAAPGSLGVFGTSIAKPEDNAMNPPSADLGDDEFEVGGKEPSPVNDREGIHEKRA